MAGVNVFSTVTAATIESAYMEKLEIVENDKNNMIVNLEER